MAKVKIAFLGTGGFMGAHAQRLKAHPDAQIVALCDLSMEQTKKFELAHLNDYRPSPQLFTDPAKMYAEAKPDAVIIATPHTLHFQHGMQALDAGLHVYMEKPMVTSAGDAHTLAAKATEKGKIVVVGYNTPCSPEFNYLRDVIRTKKLGKLELVMGYLSQDWRRLTTGLWRQKPELSGGGQAYDSGAHLLNSLVWSVESNIAEVFAFLDNVGTPVDINSSINIKFENGVMASIVVSGNCPANGAFMTFIFDGGKIDIDGWSGTWIKVWQGGQELKYPPITGKPQTPDDNFIDAILGRAEPATSPANGIIQSELMDAIYESGKTGQVARPKRR
jgi:predicted dehydrogenase